MLELIDVSKSYDIGGHAVTALDGVTARFETASFCSIVGPSGAGKSTLLHILGALDVADHGSVRFDGQDIGGFTDNQLSQFRRNTIGFVFQFFNLLPAMNAWENVALPTLLNGGTLRSAKPRALELLEMVDLAERAEHRPAELSGGQMQRVAVARALMMDAPIILADEPTGNLDSRSGAMLLDLFRRIAHDPERSRTVITVTHDREAIAATDRVLTLQDGAIVADENGGA
ncbi:ABC transporter ATP-binding protein [Rhodococcus fascians]|nr:ABC transporter ATP-binding protein [Rhodococcus fascians]MBY4058106.1 ABC transporter ATP-binding protein [Rhodococcus fascians]MBY4069749.1 ABC transporter ATP-binding protein [Rhodococcus fascians]